MKRKIYIHDYLLCFILSVKIETTPTDTVTSKKSSILTTFTPPISSPTKISSDTTTFEDIHETTETTTKRTTEYFETTLETTESKIKLIETTPKGIETSKASEMSTDSVITTDSLKTTIKIFEPSSKGFPTFKKGKLSSSLHILL